MPQFKTDWFHLGRFRSSFLPALLVVALGVTGVVTLHAYKASRGLRTTVEQVLAAYVSFVAERAQLTTQQAIYSCAETWLHPVMSAKGSGRADAIRMEPACGAKDGRRFELDLLKNRAITAQDLSQAEIDWLLKVIPGNAEIERVPGWHIGTLLTTVEGKTELISYTVRRENGVESRAVGFVAVGALDQIVDLAMSQLLLPEAFGSAGKLSDYFYLSTNKQALDPLKAQQSLVTQERALDPAFGGLVVRAALLPAGLQKLGMTELPRNRGWEFITLFALAAALVASSLLLLRREEQLARTRANFVSGVSHELRTPLAQIRMFAEMLLLGRVRSESDKRRSLEIIDTEARRLSQLVENVLQIARSENGHSHVNPTDIRLAPVVRECIESFSVLAQARSIEFRMELQDDLIAHVDSAALRQVVLNLLDNAAKYGPVGQRVVAGVALFENAARIWVDDEGPGVPMRERQRVFDPFYRMRDAQHATGSGIGLSVVRELVSLHGGDVWIEDAPDAGARVVVQFPGAYLTSEQNTGDFAVA